MHSTTSGLHFGGGMTCAARGGQTLLNGKDICALEHTSCATMRAFGPVKSYLMHMMEVCSMPVLRQSPARGWRTVGMGLSILVMVCTTGSPPAGMTLAQICDVFARLLSNDANICSTAVHGRMGASETIECSCFWQ